MLTIYAPFHHKESKAWRVFDNIKQSWPDDTEIINCRDRDLPKSPSLFWGLANGNLARIKHLEQQSLDYWFSDTPYYGRFQRDNITDTNHYWRLCKNNIHSTEVFNCPADRFSKFNIDVVEPTLTGSHILVCPSSKSIESFINQENWTQKTVKTLRKNTDRQIVVRTKPKQGNLKGPEFEITPLQKQLKNCWACVTSCSLVALQALLQGVPVFCHPRSFASPVANTELSMIESPQFVDVTQWAHSLAYQQFTPEELRSGVATDIIKEFYHA